MLGQERTCGLYREFVSYSVSLSLSSVGIFSDRALAICQHRLTYLQQTNILL